MADKKKTATEKPKVEDKPVKEPKAEEPKVEEPKAEKPISGAPAPTGDVATPAGTDQHGRQLYNVKCATCGKQAQVPFKPTGDRPVYCRDCYMQQKGGKMGGGMRGGPRR